jgi:sec-independent protein translocase protein TatB
MFDIGFSEIVLIGLVALLVVGPKELPGLVRGVASLLARVRAITGELKSEFDREIAQADELKRLVEREAQIAELHEIAQETSKTIPIGAPITSRRLETDASPNRLRAGTVSADEKPAQTSHPRSDQSS